MQRLMLGFLASHDGSNVQAIIDACKQGGLAASLGVVISNNSRAHVLERAKKERVPRCHLSSRTHPVPEELDMAILETLKTHHVNLVILAGYMKPLGPHTISHFRNRILNTHPSLLPKYGGKGLYGKRVHEAVLAAGERVTGVTIHGVNEEYDRGRIVSHTEVPVLEDDTADSLNERVLKREHEFYVEILQRISQGEIDLD